MTSLYLTSLKVVTSGYFTVLTTGRSSTLKDVVGTFNKTLALGVPRRVTDELDVGTRMACDSAVHELLFIVGVQYV